MRSGAFTESTVEEAALAWLEATGWQVAHGPEIAPEMPAAEPPIAETEPALRASWCSTPQVGEKRQQ